MFSVHSFLGDIPRRAGPSGYSNPASLSLQFVGIRGHIPRNFSEMLSCPSHPNCDCRDGTSCFGPHFGMRLFRCTLSQNTRSPISSELTSQNAISFEIHGLAHVILSQCATILVPFEPLRGIQPFLIQLVLGVPLVSSPLSF